MNYAQLSQALQDYLQNDESTFVSEIPTIVKQAEDRIFQTCQLPVFKRNASSAMTGGSRFVAAPSDFLAVASMAITQGGSEGYALLLEKEVAFLQEAYPRPSDVGQPRFYALWDDNTFLVAPIPDTAYPVELHYYYRPPSIVDTGTSWLGTNAESALLYGCLVEAYTFMKGEQDMLQLYAARYADALGRLKNLGEARNKTDALREDNPRPKVT